MQGKLSSSRFSRVVGTPVGWSERSVVVAIREGETPWVGLIRWADEVTRCPVR
jgi:hypothetical protein